MHTPRVSRLVSWGVGLLLVSMAIAGTPSGGATRGSTSQAVQSLPAIDSQVVVLGVVVNGQARAYPLLALFGPEVVNDDLGGKPIAVTF